MLLNKILQLVEYHNINYSRINKNDLDRISVPPNRPFFLLMERRHLCGRPWRNHSGGSEKRVSVCGFVLALDTFNLRASCQTVLRHPLRRAVRPDANFEEHGAGSDDPVLVSLHRSACAENRRGTRRRDFGSSRTDLLYCTKIRSRFGARTDK